MSVLAIVSIKNGAPTKSGLEAASYAANYAASQGMTASALVAGEISGDGGLGATGIAKVLHCTEPVTDSGQWAKLTEAAAVQLNASAIVASHDHFGRAVAPRVAVRLKAGLVAGVTELPSNDLVRKNVFFGQSRCGRRREHCDCSLHRDPQCIWRKRCPRASHGRAFFCRFGHCSGKSDRV